MKHRYMTVALSMFGIITVSLAIIFRVPIFPYIAAIVVSITGFRILHKESVKFRQEHRDGQLSVWYKQRVLVQGIAFLLFGLGAFLGGVSGALNGIAENIITITSITLFITAALSFSLSSL